MSFFNKFFTSVLLMGETRSTGYNYHNPASYLRKKKTFAQNKTPDRENRCDDYVR